MALRKDREGDAPFVARSDLSAYLNRLAHDWPQPPRPTSRFHTADEDARRTVTLTKAARESFDTLAAESIEAVFQAVLTAATQDGDMAAVKLLNASYLHVAEHQCRSTFHR